MLDRLECEPHTSGKPAVSHYDSYPQQDTLKKRGVGTIQFCSEPLRDRDRRDDRKVTLFWTQDLFRMRRKGFLFCPKTILNTKELDVTWQPKRR